jgi:hypothetical protein
MESVVSKLDAMIRIKAEIEKGFFNLFLLVQKALDQYLQFIKQYFLLFPLADVLIFLYLHKQAKKVCIANTLSL